MDVRKRDFIEFMCASSVLTFGDFTTKSGRSTPYFINTGKYTTGSEMRTLGEAYARTLVEQFGDDFDVLFGPAYKGIPLVVATSLALLEHHGRDVPFCFNRKEAKDHGEGGVLVGHAPRDGDRIVILEDVTTAGTSIRETVPILKHAAQVEVVGLVVSVDRMERGPGGEKSALAELADEFDMVTAPIVSIDEIVGALGSGSPSPFALGESDLTRIADYRRRYGAGPSANPEPVESP